MEDRSVHRCVHRRLLRLYVCTIVLLSLDPLFILSPSRCWLIKSRVLASSLVPCSLARETRAITRNRSARFR